MISSNQFVSAMTQWFYPTDDQNPRETLPGVRVPGPDPKARFEGSNPMPALAAQAIVSLVALQGVARAARDEKLGVGVTGQLGSFIDDYCGSTGRPPIPPPPHVLLTAVLLQGFASRLAEGSFRSGLEGAASQLVERAFAKGAAH